MTGPDETRPAVALGFIHRAVPGALGADGPTLVLLHGTGGDEQDLLPLAARLAPGANLLGVRGKVQEGGLARYFRRLGEGVFDQEDVMARAAELAAFLPAAARSYGFDGRLFAVGYSNGANMAAALLLLQPGLLKGAVLFRAMLPLTAPAQVDLAGTAVLISNGQSDPLTSKERAQELSRVLSNCGATVTTKWQKSGHGLVEGDLTDGATWLGWHCGASQRGPADS